MDIIAEMLSDSAAVRKHLRPIFRNSAMLKSVAADAETAAMLKHEVASKPESNKLTAFDDFLIFEFLLFDNTHILSNYIIS